MLARFDIRLPDIKSNPLKNCDDFDGSFSLPLDEFIDYKKMGMK